MITKEMIRKGFENNVISLQDGYILSNGIRYIIGDVSFLFTEETQSLYEYWNRYTLDETIDKLYDILSQDTNPANLEFYEDILGEFQELDLN